jgi:hypothetical protein
VKPLYDGAPLSYSEVRGTDAIGAGNIYVDVIAERAGQKLRSHLVDALRDIKFVRKKYRLGIILDQKEKPFAFSADGNAKRVFFIYSANVVLTNEEGKKLSERNISASTSYNIAHTQGEVGVSLYGRYNDALLKELSCRIIENIKTVLINEN